MRISGKKDTGQKKYKTQQIHDYTLRFTKTISTNCPGINEREAPCLFFEYKINGQYQKTETYEMIQPELLVLKEQKSKAHEYYERYDFLQHFQLHKGERSSVVAVAQSVRRDLKTVFEKRYTPTYQYHSPKTEFGKPAVLGEFEMTVPGHCHKGIGTHKK